MTRVPQPSQRLNFLQAYCILRTSHLQVFLQGLMDMYLDDARAGRLDRALLLAAAGVQLLRGHALLAELAVSQNYVEQLLQLTASCVNAGELQQCTRLTSSRIESHALSCSARSAILQSSG